MDGKKIGAFIAVNRKKKRINFFLHICWDFRGFLRCRLYRRKGI